MPRKVLAILVVAGIAAARPAGAVVLKTITVDGNVADWAEVLADPLQISTDGNPDLDAPVPSTGRDLVRFAWTYDATYLYVYVSRVGSDNNRQRFWFYLDTNDDLRMSTGEPVLGVSWSGSTGRTDVERWRYVATSGAGDPMASPSGQADGFDVPGSVALVSMLESVTGGSATGREMESRIPWASLGVPTGTPMRFHVSASASTNLPSQVHDNMGSPSGGVGYIRVSAVRIEPDRTSTVMPAASAFLAHRVTNDGAATDRVDLAWSVTGSLVPSAVSWVADLDGDGVLDPGEPALTDSDGNGSPDTGPLAPGAGSDALLVVSAPAGAAEGSTATLLLTARSASRPEATETATDRLTVAVPRLALVKSVDRAAAAPGDVLTYSIAYSSTGSAAAHTVVLVDAVPAPTRYVPGSATASATGTVVEYSHDGGATFDASELPPVTHVRFRLATALVPGTSGSVAFRAGVP